MSKTVWAKLNKISKLKAKYQLQTLKAKKEQELKFAEEKFVHMIRYEEEQRKQEETRKKEVITAKNNILESLRGNNIFNHGQFLIVWDIVTSNYEQIKINLVQARISITDLEKVLQYVEQFSPYIVSESQKGRLFDHTA